MTEQICGLYKKCGGCQMMNLPYAEQLRWKEKRVRILLDKFGKVQPIIGMDNPYHYRNKVQAAFKPVRGRIVSGVYQSGTHRVVPVDSCLLEDEKADAIIVTVRGLLRGFKIPAYDEDVGRGVLRHVLVRRGFTSGEIMVVLVSATPVFPSCRNFVKALLEKHPAITTVVLNVNPYQTNLVLGPQERVLYGSGTIEDTLCGKVFRISPKSFYQINPVQTEVLYSTAIGYADLHGTETVIDAYCGIGTIGLAAADKAGHVIGAELNRDAVQDAIFNCRRNNIRNARFYCADAGEFMTEMAQSGETADVLFMDPPRAGSSPAFLHAAARLAPKRIVYISCNPETQSRDLDVLTKSGYKVRRIQPVDMFPHTNHVETVCLLVREIEKARCITVEVRPDELQLDLSKAGATYAQIKDYVQKRFGMTVSSLNIAQTKRKCGLPVSEAYNKPKENGNRVPNCTPEKEDAIMQALRFFGMIE